MPSQRSKQTDHLPDFDFFSTLADPVDTSKLQPKKKKGGKKKNNEAPAVVAEQSDQEEAAEQQVSKIQDEDYSQDFLEPETFRSPPVSQSPTNRTQNPNTSSIFAALGDAFRDKPVAASRQPTQPQQEDEDAVEPCTRSPTRQELISTSPPTSRPQPVPYSPPNEVRGGFSPPIPTSPRLAYRRRPSGYTHQPDSLATSPRGRPISMPAYMWQPSAFNLNNMRGIAGDVLANGSRSTSRKATKYTYMSLDSLASAGDSATTSENALLAASEHTLFIFHLGKDKASEIGKIGGLRGHVVSAKIIPASSLKDSLRKYRPLVAVIVHGPEGPHEELSRPSSRQSDHSFNPSYPHDARAIPVIQKYQTTVEIYSLKLHMHLATLFASKSEQPRISNVFGKQSYEPPGPVGSLSVHSTDRYIAVVSNESGEIYLYDHHSGRPEQPFRCIGKTWTSVLTKKSRTWSSSSAPEATGSRDESPTRQTHDAPLLAISGRMLAYIPPIASSRSSILGRVHLPTTGGEIPGLSSHTASSQPQANTTLETPLDGGMVNEIARGVTQEVLKGATWVGNQSVQAWKNYWNPKSPEANSQAEYANHNQFPPTHASDDPNRVTQRPTIVSFLDLDQLADSHSTKSQNALQPSHSITLPGGCSYLSLSPTGLGMLTANAKGDVQNVWDLTQVNHPKSAITSRTNKSKDRATVVRQIARFTRITETNIVDVAWSRSQVGKLAILTSRGTVHIHDIPIGFLHWPPLPNTDSTASRNQDLEQNSTTPSSWDAAFNAVSSGARTISATVRINPLARFSEINLAQASAGAGAKGGKIVVKSISRSVEAASGTVSAVMSIGETRLHLPGGADSVLPGSTRWWFMKEDEAIAVIGDDLVRVHKIEYKKEKKPGKKKYSVVGRRILEIAIPNPRERIDASDWDIVNDGYDVVGDWVTANKGRSTSSPLPQSGPLSHTEIETSSPFPPVYRDHRVEHEVFSDDTIDHEVAWAFGQDIPSRPLNTVAFQAPVPDYDDPLELSAQIDGDELSKLVERVEQKLPFSDAIEEPFSSHILDADVEPSHDPPTPLPPPVVDEDDIFALPVKKKKKSKLDRRKEKEVSAPEPPKYDEDEQYLDEI